jgi:hypothetical protein
MKTINGVQAISKEVEMNMSGVNERSHVVVNHDNFSMQPEIRDEHPSTVKISLFAFLLM